MNLINHRNLLAQWKFSGSVTDFSWKPASDNWGWGWVCMHNMHRPWPRIPGASWLLELPVSWEQQNSVNGSHATLEMASFTLSAYNCISSWIVTKACSWDALSLLGYEAEEHQLSAANPLNSLDKFHWQFLLDQWQHHWKYFCVGNEKHGQTNLMGNVTSRWLAWGEEGLQDPVLTTVSEACNLDPSVHTDTLSNKQTSWQTGKANSKSL